MRINTKSSIALGAKIHERFGSWAEARKAARVEDGAYVLPSETTRQPIKAETAKA